MSVAKRGEMGLRIKDKKCTRRNREGFEEKSDMSKGRVRSLS